MGRKKLLEANLGYMPYHKKAFDNLGTSGHAATNK
jgi:hypothetical protein